MEFTIFSIGDSAFLEQVLIALALLGGTDDFSAMVQVGLLVGVFSTILSAIAKGGKSIEFQHVLLGYIIWATMFVPTARVNIEDTYTGDVRIVDNVPMGPAAAGGLITTIGYRLTEMFEVAYDPIIPRVTETEFAESLKILTDIRNKSTTSSIWRSLNTDQGGGFVDMQSSWVNYVKDCTLKRVDVGQLSPTGLVTGRFQESLRFDSQLFGTQIFVQPANPVGQDFNCADAWDELIDRTDLSGARTTLAFNAILGFDANNLPAGQTSITKTQSALDALTGAAVDSATYMQLAVLEPILMEAASGKYNQVQDFTASTMINTAIQQRNTQWAAEQSLFMTVVRPMLAFFESFIYAIAPIMAFVIVLGAKGMQLAAKYFTLLIWIQLWMPLLTIVNLYIYIASSRKLEVYSSMGSHNWDSFYALNTSADVLQSWIATGGVLAASTPALALMLIYGSSVTATHLAGRLKGSDAIDEKTQTPDLKNNSPVANVAPIFSGDSVNGMLRSGTEGALSTATVSSVVSGITSSSSAHANTETEQFNDTLSNSIRNSSSADEMYSKARAIGLAARSSDSTIASNAESKAKAFRAEHGIKEEHLDAITGMAGLSAQLGASLNLDKAAGFMASKFGVAETAAKKFLQDAGVKGKQGDGVVPSGGGKGPLEIKASASASANAQSRTTDQTSSSFGQGANTSDGYQFSEQEQAQYAKDVSSSFARENAETFRKTWGSDDASTVSRAAAELATASQTFSSVSNLQNTLGTISSMQMRTVGALAAGRDDGGMQGNIEAQNTLNEGWAAQPESVKNHARDLTNRYKNWNMPEDVAVNTARLTALTDSNNFKDDPSAHLAATSLAANVIRQATGIGTGDNFEYNRNSDLDKPSFEQGDIKEKTDALEDPKDTNAQARNRIQTSAEKQPEAAFSEGGQVATDGVRKDFDTNASDVKESGGEKEKSMVDRNEQQFRRNVLDAPDRSMAAIGFGAFDNVTGWTGRKAESIAGGTEAFLREFGSGVGESYDAYKNLDDGQAAQFRQSIRDQDDMLFDSLGIAGLPVKGAQVVGNHIIGAAVAGVDAGREWLNGGSDLSAQAEGMTIQEKGAFFAAASGEAAREGGHAFAAFMEQYGDEFKDTMQQVGETRYGLTDKQAAIFAESYDTNSDAMREKVLSFQKDYAIRDSSGQPVWDNEQSQWRMTPENREFTDAVVDRITMATGAGDRVGSYLEPVSGYNVATQQVTPR